MRDQFTVTVEDENGQAIELRREAKLRDRSAIEIRHDENILPRIVVDPLAIILRSQAIRFGVETIADDCLGQALQRRQELVLKIDHRDVAITPVAEVTVGDVIGYGLRLRLILPRDDRNDGDVTIRRGKFVPIDVVKEQPGRASCLQRIRGGQENQRENRSRKALKGRNDHV